MNCWILHATQYFGTKRELHKKASDVKKIYVDHLYTRPVFSLVDLNFHYA
jgi:hypothetical protein